MAGTSDPRDLVEEALRRAADAPTAIGPEGVRQRRAQRRARNVEIMTLRLAGMSQEKIAERFGIKQTTVSAILAKMLAQAQQLNADEMRALENARLDRVQAAIWPQVLQGDLKAIGTYLRLSQQRSAINGLNAPTRVELAVSVKQELEQAFTELEALVLEVEQLPDPKSGTGSRKARQREAIESRSARDAARYAEEMAERIAREAALEQQRAALVTEQAELAEREGAA